MLHVHSEFCGLEGRLVLAMCGGQPSCGATHRFGDRFVGLKVQWIRRSTRGIGGLISLESALHLIDLADVGIISHQYARVLSGSWHA